jgi:hypothetical protein
MRYGDGAFVPQDLGPGMGGLDNLTLAGNLADSYNDSPLTTAQAASQDTQQPSYLWYFLAIFIVLVALRFASEHEKIGIKDEPHLAGIGVWNFVTITLMALLGLTTLKTIFNKYPVRGLTDFVNAA